jgi:hypothetical protein
MTMTTTETSALVFKDQAGEYYLVPQETLAQGRVPEERKAQIEHLIAEQQDAQGYAINHGGSGGPSAEDYQFMAVLRYNAFLRWQWDTAR